MVPDDIHEGEPITALIAADGIKVVVPSWRGDAGNDGLHASVKQGFEVLEGTVTNDVRYDPATTNFSTVLNAAKAQVRPAIDRYGAPKVGLYLAGFDEVVPLFDHASNDSLLSSSRWYGSDGAALIPALTQTAQAASFAAKVGYPNLFPGLDESVNTTWGLITQRFKAKVGSALDTFTLAAHDAFWIATLAHLTTGPSPSLGALKLAFTHAANSYFGATGWTALNDAGDRKIGNYDYWAVRRNNGSFRWVRVGRYAEGAAGQPGRVVLITTSGH